MAVTTRVQKRGNSLAVRIPSHIAQETGIHQESEVDICVEGSIIIGAEGKLAGAAGEGDTGKSP